MMMKLIVHYSMLSIAFITQIVCGDDSVYTSNCLHSYMTSNAISLMVEMKASWCQPSTSYCDTSPCLGDNMMITDGLAQQLYAWYFGRRRKRAFAINIPSRQWSLPIPYMFNLSATAAPYEVTIRNALSHIEAQSCLSFLEVPLVSSPTKPVLIFDSGPGCVSFTGQNSDSSLNPISLTNACVQDFGTIVNLVSMSLGLVNEEQRPDRSSYIYVNNNNVVTQHIPDLVIQNATVFSTFGLPYDLASVMHNPPLIFSKNAGLTLMTINPLYQNTIGQRTGLSFLDAKLINTLYCAGNCSSYSTPSCLNGGYPDPRNCVQCKCPDGYSGTVCDAITSHNTSSCGQQLININSGSGVIKSPGYDPPTQAYIPGGECTWKITTPVGTILSLTFFGDFGIYCEDLSCYHWAEVRYSGLLNTTGPRFCCGTLPKLTLISTGNEVMVLFRSNYTSNYATPNPVFRGFQLLYSVVVCVDKWSAPFINLNSPNGKVAPYNVDQQECLDYCAYNVTGCLGVDIDTNIVPYPQCYVHTSASDLQMTAIASGVNQYRILNSACPTTTSSTTTTSTPSSTRLTAPPSSSATRPTPIKTTSAITTVSSTTTTTTTPSTSTVPAPPVTSFHVSSTLLTTIPRPIMTSFTSKTSSSTTAAPTSTTMVTLGRPTPTVSTTTIGPVQTTYVATSVGQPTTSLGQPTTSLSTTVLSSACQTTWIVRNSTNSVGATRISNIASQNSCLTYCINNASCLAVDIDTNYYPPNCWMHVNINDLNQKYSTPGVNQYQMLNRCPQTTSGSTPIGCQPTWLTYVNTHAMGGVCEGTMSLSNCLYYCATNPVCIAVDYDTTLQLCWVHTGGDLGREYYQAGIVQYQLINRCYTLAPTAVQTTYASLSGWSDWSQCSASCGAYGSQSRYYWILVQTQFVQLNEEYRTCNTQTCPCQIYNWGCSPCCSGFYEYSGSCQVYAK